MSDVLQGTLELLVLKTLSLQPMHGWGISQRIQQLSSDMFSVGQGSLYPALRRLEERDWVEAEWRVTEHGRRARFYSLTRSGRRALASEIADWRAYTVAVGEILEAK